MKFFKYILLSLLLISFNLKAVSQSERIDLCNETSRYYKVPYLGRACYVDSVKLRTYMFSADRVAQMVPSYPAKNEKDRMLIFFQFGELESCWQSNCIELNIPGATYSNGKVKYLSVDFSAFGVNEGDVKWTYAVAKAIQDGRDIPYKIGDWHSNPRFESMMANVDIPEDLRLKKIDLRIAEIYKIDYYKQRLYYSDPNQLREVMIKRAPKFECNTQDDIDSTLLYRVIEDMYRISLGWKHGLRLYSPNKYRLYNHLNWYIKEKPEMQEFGEEVTRG